MFWALGILMILLHMGPMAASASWDVYQEGGINVRPPNVRHTMSKAQYLAYLRSQAQKAIFAKAHPCPSTMKPIQSCPGYVIDHVKPLCDGGLDKATNMQWQTLAASYKKDAIERRVCACHKTGRTDCVDPWASKQH